MAIRVLSESVIDQIAAGEVLERPAHLIKELVENSLDAGATEIEVDFDQGGRRVKVSDNGSGMGPKDIELALVRHATSKIETASDLFALSSFGFRGEALASIAAVSRLSLTSRTSNALKASRMTCDFGINQGRIETEATLGTTIIVESLFENVPARLKFLKSEGAESAQIKQVLRALALAHPSIQFRVRSRNELLFIWQAKDDWRARAEDILEFHPFHLAEGEESGVKVRILFGSPDQTLKQNRGIWLLVQGRFVQDRSLIAAILEAYRNLLMHGEFPHVVLDLHVPKDFIDVNVHPTKSQVKFQDPQTVFRTVLRTLRAGLELAPWLGSAKIQTPIASVEPVAITSSFPDPSFSRLQYQKKMFPLNEVKESVSAYRPEMAAEPSRNSDVPSNEHWGRMEVLGQANLTYIICQSSDTLYLVDQHAAHERIVFERLMTQWREGKFHTQRLLLPLVIDLESQEAEALDTAMNDLRVLGLEIEKMGPVSVAISAIPAFVSETAVVESLQNLAAGLVVNGGSLAWERRVGDIFASMACHTAVRAGQAMSTEEMRDLLKQMDEFSLSTFCPHGRPVTVAMPFGELERKFGRIV